MARGLVPGLPRGRPRCMIDAGPRRRHRLHLQQERASSPAPTTSRTARPRPTRPTRSGCSPPSSASTASGSTASTPTASSAAPASSPAAGAPSGPPSTACRRRSSARSTPSGRCSSARCCPSTSPPPSSRSTAGDLSQTTGLHVPVDAGVAAASCDEQGRDRARLAAVDLGASSGRVCSAGSARTRSSSPRSAGSATARSALPDGLYWDVLGLYQDILDGLRAAERRPAGWPGSAIDSWARRLRPARRATARCSATPATTATPGPPPCSTTCTPSSTRRRLYELDRRCSSCRSTRSTSSPPTADAALDAGRQALLMPDLLGYWLTGVAGRRADQRLDHRPARRRAPATGRRSWSRRSACPPALLPDAGARRPRCSAGVTAGAGRAGLDHELLVSAVGSHDTASAVVGVPAATTRFGYISCGTWAAGRRRARRAGAHRGQPAGELHQRARRRRHDPLPAQRDGPVAAQESLRTWSLRGPGVELADAARRRGRAAARRPAHRPRRPGVPAARRHAGAHRAPPAGAASPSPDQPGRGRPVHPRQPRARVRRRDRRRRSGSPARPSRSCTSSAAAPATRCSAS